MALNAKRPDIRVFSQSGQSLVVQCGGLGIHVEDEPLNGALSYSSPRRRSSQRSSRLLMNEFLALPGLALFDLPPTALLRVAK